MRATKVLAVISSSEIGGAERYFCSWTKGLSELGIKVSVACPQGPMLSEYARHAADVTPVRLASIYDRASILALKALMHKSGAQVVHTHLWNADVLGSLAARGLGRPRLVSTVYGPYHLPIGLGPLRSLRRHALSLTYRAAYRPFDRVIAVSEFVRQDLAQREGVRVEERRVSVIDPALDLETPTVAPATNGAEFRSGSGPNLACVANFHPIKGQEWLLRALPAVRAAYPNLVCRFIGEGPERRRLEGLAADLRLGASALFYGSVGNPCGLVEESDLFILPSLSEGLPHSILEAWALGTPVIASRAGGIPEAVHDGQSGLLVPPGSPEALTAAILSALADRGLRDRLRAGGRSTLRRRFGLASSAQKTADLYETVLDAPSRAA